MATITAQWTENQSLIDRQASGCNALGAGNSETQDIDLDANGYDRVAVQVEVTFGGSPDGDVDVELLASVNSGTDDDTIALNSVTITNATSTTKRITLVADGIPYVAVKVTNNDSADDIDVVAIYAGRKWDST